MIEGWKEVKLGEITEMIKRGIAPKYVEDEGYIVINQKCIRDGVLSFDDSRLTSISKRVSEEKFIQIGDVLINSTGTGTLGRTAPVRRLLGKTTVDTHVTIFRGKDSVHKLFLGYLLKYHEPLITLLGKGATNQIELGSSDLKVSKVKIPKSKETQRKIASILSAYDDLIENNLKRIKLLEEQAQQTYEEWFVRFKFPGNENVEVDEVSGLPEGWEVTEIQELSSVITGKTPTTSKSQYYGNDIPFIKTPDLHSSIYMTNVEQFLSLEGANSQKNKFFEKNTILLSCIGARAGAVGLTSEISQCNQQINGMICKDEVYIFYLYFFCRGLTPLLRALGSNGATMTNVSKGKLEKVNIVKPHLNIITSFHSKVKNDFAVILNLQNQNQHLKEARDILLPRLMSGMIDVDGLEVSEKLGMVAEEQANHTQ